MLRCGLDAGILGVEPIKLGENLPERLLPVDTEVVNIRLR